jgi:hypothetical protein
VCFFCSEPIDWSLPHPDPGSFEVHHSVPEAVPARIDICTNST